MVKPPVFSREVEKVGGFITAYRLYFKMKIRSMTMEEQIQWILSYIERGSVNIWKKNILENLETREVKFESIGKFLLGLRKEFEKKDKETVKVAELKRVKQGKRTIEEFIQEFRRVARESRYEGRVLVEELKREMSRAIKRKLIEAERPSSSIEQ